MNTQANDDLVPVLVQPKDYNAIAIVKLRDELHFNIATINFIFGYGVVQVIDLGKLGLNNMPVITFAFLH